MSAVHESLMLGKAFVTNTASHISRDLQALNAAIQDRKNVSLELTGARFTFDDPESPTGKTTVQVDDPTTMRALIGAYLTMHTHDSTIKENYVNV